MLLSAKSTTSTVLVTIWPIKTMILMLSVPVTTHSLVNKTVIRLVAN